MTTNIFCPLFLIGHSRRIFFVFFLAVCSPGLFAQSDKAFQVEVGAEQYFEFIDTKAAAGGLFVEGKYQKGQFDFGIKAGRPLFLYGTDKPSLVAEFDNRNYSIIDVDMGKPYFKELLGYFEASVNYKPNFRHAKPFFGIGCRYLIREDHQIERIVVSSTQHFSRESPSYFVPVLNMGYYYKNLKFQLNFVFGEKVRPKINSSSVVYYSGYIQAGASYIFGVGPRTSRPSYEMSFSQKERVFRPLAFRIETGIGHQMAFSKYGISSSMRLFVEAKAKVKEQLRIGVQLNIGGSLGIDRNSQEVYFNSEGEAHVRSLNSGSQVSSFIIFGEQVLKSTVTKDILVVGAGLGLYTIEKTGKNSYKDNGVTIELPPQLKQANLPGLHLRVGQRFGAFSHSAFVNLIPGQVPVTFGVQLGLGLNIFGKKQ